MEFKTGRGIIKDAHDLAAGGLIFASGSGGARGSTVRLEPQGDSVFGPVVGAARDMAGFLAEFPNLVIVWDNALAHGGGVTLKRGDDNIYAPFGLVRGHPHIDQAEFDSLPDWARAGYEWREKN